MGPKKLRKFLIVFDNSSLLYFPGHLISGRVIAELDEMTPVTGVYLHVMGESVVRVTDRQQQTLHDEENYLNFRLRLHGEPDANYPLESESGAAAGKDQAAQTLDRGIHSFPFKLGLPLGLPSTFLGKHGYVQYFCRAALREANGLTHKNQQAFIVMNPIDLNLEPSILAQPFLCEVEQRLGLSCLAGPVNCKVRLDRGGYVPGENIIVWARVRNSSRVPIRRTRACLTETVQYMTRNKVVETEMRELASAARGRIPSGASDEWNDEQLTVPPLPPTNLTGSRLIRIQYDMLFIIEPAGLERSIKLQLPIRLATYPFRDAEGTLKRPAHYPESLPILRPWMPGKDGP